MAEPTGPAEASSPELVRASWAKRPGRFRSAGPQAQSRRENFIKTTIAVLGETGRTDFTVQEIVERSRTSLRAFYQHFSTKDELLLALFDEVMGQSARAWRYETAELNSTAALRVLIDRVSAQPESTTQHSINRALTLYNQHLAETRPREYARILSPFHQLIAEIIDRGIAEQTFSSNLEVEITAAIVMQTMLDALRLHSIGAELAGEPVTSNHLFEFCMRALGVARGITSGQ